MTMLVPTSFAGDVGYRMVKIFMNKDSWMEMFWILIQISVNFVSWSQIDTSGKSAFVKVMAWHLTGNKPLPEPKSTKLLNAIWCHKATMS